MHPITTESRQINASTTNAGSANATSLDLERMRKDVDLSVNVSADALVTLEVSTDGSFDGEEKQADTVTYSGSSTDFRQYDIAYQHVRAFANASVNELELVSRGI